jgi:hypothetical protein
MMLLRLRMSSAISTFFFEPDMWSVGSCAFFRSAVYVFLLLAYILLPTAVLDPVADDPVADSPLKPVNPVISVSVKPAKPAKTAWTFFDYIMVFFLAFICIPTLYLWVKILLEVWKDIWNDMFSGRRRW